MRTDEPRAAFVLSPSERQALEGYARRRTSGQSLTLQARLVLGRATGKNSGEVADEFGVNTVGRAILSPYL